LEREVGRVHDQVVAETESRLRGLLEAAGVNTEGMAATDLARAVAESGIDPTTAVPDGAYATVAATAGAVLARGQDDAYRTVRRLSSGLERESPVRDDDAESAALGLAVGGLVGSLTSWLREKLFTVAGADPDTGELLAGRADGINPPLSLLVNAATVAGGGQGATVGSVGVANGAQVESWLDGLSVSTTGWVWQYGDPGMRASQFEPHRRLDGQEFADWESDVLAHSGWPGSRLAPQDHRGCGCGAARVLAATPGVSPTPG
jgi:ribosomal protein L12E/L44/L45/RPP1/RPP2